MCSWGDVLLARKVERGFVSSIAWDIVLGVVGWCEVGETVSEQMLVMISLGRGH